MILSTAPNLQRIARLTSKYTATDPVTALHRRRVVSLGSCIVYEARKTYVSSGDSFPPNTAQSNS